MVFPQWYGYFRKGGAYLGHIRIQLDVSNNFIVGICINFVKGFQN